MDELTKGRYRLSDPPTPGERARVALDNDAHILPHNLHCCWSECREGWAMRHTQVVEQIRAAEEVVKAKGIGILKAHMNKLIEKRTDARRGARLGESFILSDEIGICEDLIAKVTDGINETPPMAKSTEG